MSRRGWVLFALMSAIWGVPYLFIKVADRGVSAAVPIMGVVLARLTGGAEHGTRWVGLAAGLAGVALLAGPGALGGDAWSVAAVLLAALGYATGPLVVSRKLAGLPGLGVTAVCLALAAVVYAPAVALTWPGAMPRPAVLAALATLGVVCTATAFVLFFQLIAEAGAARATVITYVNPAVAVTGGVVVLGEPLTWGIVGAFGLILAGSVLATRSGLSGPPGPPAAAVARSDGQAGRGVPR